MLPPNGGTLDTFAFACLQHLTPNMVEEMDGDISRVLFCNTIFSKLKLNGIWGKFGHPGETLDSRLLCTSNDLEWLPSMWFMTNNMPMMTVDHK